MSEIIKTITPEKTTYKVDGPAVEYPNGDKHYYIDGKLHRTDGPAVEWTDGYKAYYIDGKLHREDGPAVEYPNGKKECFLHGIKVDNIDCDVTKLKIVLLEKQIAELREMVYVYFPIREMEKLKNENAKLKSRNIELENGLVKVEKVTGCIE